MQTGAMYVGVLELLMGAIHVWPEFYRSVQIFSEDEFYVEFVYSPALMKSVIVWALIAAFVFPLILGLHKGKPWLLIPHLFVQPYFTFSTYCLFVIEAVSVFILSLSCVVVLLTVAMGTELVVTIYLDILPLYVNKESVKNNAMVFGVVLEMALFLSLAFELWCFLVVLGAYRYLSQTTSANDPREVELGTYDRRGLTPLPEEDYASENDVQL